MTQFPVVNVLTADAKARERAFIRATYAWMFGGLLLTSFSALWVVLSQPMQQIVFSKPVMWGLIIAELGLVMFLSFRVTRMKPATAASVFFIYSLLNGFTLSAIFFVYQIGSVVSAFLVAAGMFGAMSIYGLATRRDLTSWGSFFFMGLIGIVLCSIVNIFLKSSGLDFVISIVGVFVFVGLTAYDTQKLKWYAANAGPDPTNLAVAGALALYLDFINLFLMLLRLFGGRRD